MPKRLAQKIAPAEEAATSTARRDGAAGGNIIAIVADAPLLDLLRAATRERHKLWRATDASQAVELLLAAPASVLLMDMAVTGDDTTVLVEKLRDQFPGMPIIVSGRRDDESRLSELISSGDIFRFLHKPPSEERVRTFLDTAVRRVAEQPPPPPAVKVEPPPVPAPVPAGSTEKSPPALTRIGRVPLAAGLLVLAAAGAALLHHAPWDRAPEPVAQPARSVAVAPAPVDPEVERLLRAGRSAVADGRYAKPAGNNAIELYRAALTRDPDNKQALDGLARAADLLLVEVESALLDGNLAAAATGLDAARAANPLHPRLAALSGQFAEEREKLVAPRKPATPAPRPPPPRAAAQQSPTAASERQKQFDRAMAAAREDIAQGQTARAGTWLARAAELGVDGPAVQQLQARLDALRLATEREERARLLALANQRIAQGRLTEPAADSARHYLDLLRAADPGFAGVADTAALLGERMLAEARQLAAAGRLQDASKMLALAADFAAPERVQAARAEIAAPPGRPAVAAVLPESSLVRIVHAPPAYPARAAARGLEGWVDVEFTVGADGQPRDVRVKAANPKGVFDSAALAAVADWRYQPPPGGDQRVGLRLRFSLGPG